MIYLFFRFFSFVRLFLLFRRWNAREGNLVFLSHEEPEIVGTVRSTKLPS